MFYRIFNKRNLNLEIEEYSQLERLIERDIIELEVISNEPIFIDLAESTPDVAPIQISTKFLREIENASSVNRIFNKESRAFSGKFKELREYVKKLFAQNKKENRFTFEDAKCLKEFRIQQKFALSKLKKKVIKQKRNLLKSQSNYGLLIDMRKVIRQIIKKSIKLSFDDQESTYLFYFKPNMGLYSRLNKLNFKLSNNEEKYFRYH